MQEEGPGFSLTYFSASGGADQRSTSRRGPCLIRIGRFDLHVSTSRSFAHWHSVLNIQVHRYFTARAKLRLGDSTCSQAKTLRVRWFAALGELRQQAFRPVAQGSPQADRLSVYGRSVQP
jgi:hypothetical protein